MKFQDYVERWKESCRLNTSEGWKLCQDKIIELHILPYLHDKDVSGIEPDDISRVLKASEIKGHAPNTTKKIYMVLSKLFNDAVEFFDLISRSPVRSRFHKPIVPKVKQPAMTWEQSVLLLEYVMNDSAYGIAVWIQLLAGARTSEIEALEWQDIKFDKGYIWLSKAYNKHTRKIQPYTKNKTHYAVMMPKKLSDYLWKHKKESGFVCEMNGGMFKRESYKDYLKIVLKRLDLPIKSPHGLRHSFAKMHKSKGATDDEIQLLLGHKSPISTKSYLHNEHDEVVAKIVKLSKKIV